MVGQGTVAVVFIREAVLIYPWFAAAAAASEDRRGRTEQLRRASEWLVFSALWMLVYVVSMVAIGFSGRLFTAGGWTSMWTILVLESEHALSLSPSLLRMASSTSQSCID